VTAYIYKVRRPNGGGHYYSTQSLAALAVRKEGLSDSSITRFPVDVFSAAPTPTAYDGGALSRKEFALFRREAGDSREEIGRRLGVSAERAGQLAVAAMAERKQMLLRELKLLPLVRAIADS
jgi:hypothetical protein